MRLKANFLILLALISTSVLGQPGGGGPGGDPDVPIQGLIYLLFAGLVFGIKKIIDKRKSG